MNQIVTLDDLEVSSSVCRWFKRLSQSDRVRSGSEDLMREPMCTAALREHILPNQVLHLCCVFALGLAIPDSQFPPFFPPSASSFIFLSFFSIIFLFWIFLQGLLRGPERPKKPLYYSHNKKQSPCIQRPCPWGLLHFCAWFPVRCHSERLMKGHDSEKENKQKEIKENSRLLFLEEGGVWFNLISWK